MQHNWIRTWVNPAQICEDVDINKTPCRKDTTLDTKQGYSILAKTDENLDFQKAS